ncbi:MAG TPA: sigma-70 family RNA polymerase sigma factor [Polyangiales bacterium]|nr:sigma-70 family RNA polymerase sigma factor [Polyangiales bacterium]
MAEARRRFTEVVGELRPELHRYCARMTGSVFDGEDIVQTAIEKAYYALGQMTEPPQLRPWLFSIAHNAAMDFLKRYERRHVALVSEVPEPEALDTTGVDAALIEAALSEFLRLPPLQRSALILKDVLGHPLVEVAAALSISVGAVKGALSRARANLDARAAPMSGPRPSSAEEQANLRRYAELFNDRNWDGLRALLGEEAQLDLVTRLKQRVVAAKYYDRYAEILRNEDIRAESGFVDGVAAIAMYRPATSQTPSYFLLLEWGEGKVAKIRDYYYVPYVASGARFVASV